MKTLPRLLLLFALLPLLALTASAQQATVNHGANLRSDPTSAQDPVGSVSKGDTVTLIDPNPQHGYYRVSTSQGQQGWVYGHFLSIGGASLVSEQSQPALTPTPAKPPVNSSPATTPTASSSIEAGTPAPLLSQGRPVDWWFVFKFNSAIFSGCASGATRTCLFGGQVQSYRAWSQQFVYASSDNHSLQQGNDCLGDSTADPVGATFDEAYNGSLHFVVWNDQFYDDPAIAGCTTSCSGPWGHSKGMIAWNDAGQGFVMQVTTPSWPAAGSASSPRKTDGNTLGCVKDDDVQVSQDFFALRLNKDDVVKVLTALQNASVVTDTANPQIVSNGGPPDIQALVKGLGVKSSSNTITDDTLSTGVQVISKPSNLNVPPWQMVSAVLGGVSLTAATWWTNPAIPPTTSSALVKCWGSSLGTPGPVAIATSGQWGGKTFSLKGGLGTNFNHAKVGVSTSAGSNYSIFGDMNQQGTLSGPNCASSQNGRGGLFYVVSDPALAQGIGNLIGGSTAPTQ
jgi:hypothetical protein